jgi:GT2 family glycosyltransferase
VLVVTPTLRARLDELLTCVRSVLGQDVGNVEHVIVDGGSDEDVLQAASAHGAMVIRAPGSSQSEAIGIGIASTEARWVTWLGADDSLRPGAVAASVAMLRQHAADWSYSACVQVFPDHTEVFRPPRRLDARSLEWGNRIAQPGALISRDAWEAVGGVDPSFNFAMDVDLWAKLLSAGYRATYVGVPVATFRVHPASKSGSAAPEEFLLEEHRAWHRAGWMTPASTTLGRARWFLHGVHSFEEPAVVPEGVDATLVVAASRTTAVIEAARQGLHPPHGALQPTLLRRGPCRRRLARAAVNSTAGRFGLSRRR